MAINWDELKKKANKKAINATLPTKSEKEKTTNENITKVVKESNVPTKSGSNTKYKKKNENNGSQSSSSSTKNEKKSDTKSSKKKQSVKESLKKQANWAIRSVKSDFLPTEERQKVQNQIAKEKAEDYQKKGGFANDKIGQAYAGFGEAVIDASPAGIAYSVAKGKKLSDSDLAKKGKKDSALDIEPTEEGKKARNAGKIAGEMLSYAGAYGAAGKATSKAAAKALSTKAGKKAVEKVAASKVGKKVGEETVKKAAKELTKDAIADATVGSAMDYGLGKGEGLEGKELAKYMGENALLNIGIGGAVDLAPVALRAVSKKAGKNTLRTATKAAEEVADNAPKTAKTASESVEKTVNAELPTKAVKEAENAKKTASIGPEYIDEDYMNYLLREAEKEPRKRHVKTARSTTLPTKETLNENFTSDTFGYEHWESEKDVKKAIRELNQKAKNGTLTDDDKWKAVAILADNAQEASGGLSQEVKELQKYLRTLPININDTTKRGIANGYNNLRKSNFGNLRLANSGQDIDTVYNSLREEFPGVLKGAETQEDQLEELVKLANQKATYTNAYEMIPPEDLANGLYEMLNNNLTKKTVDYRGKLRTINSKNVTPQATQAVSTTTSNVPSKGTTVQTDIPQSLKSQQPEIKVNSKGEEIKVADFDVEGSDVLGIVSPGSQAIQEAMENASGFFDRFYKNFVNSHHEIDKLSKAARDMRASNAVQAAKSASGTSEYIYTKGLVNPKGEVIDDRSFYDVFKPISKNSKEFNQYAQHLNNISRWAEGKPLDENITAEQSKQFVNDMLAKHPEFAQMTQNLNSWWQKFTHAWLVDTGRMTENAWQAMTTKYPNYVPAFMSDKGVKIGGSKFSIGAGTKAAKAGNTLNRIPIEDAMMQQVQQMVKTTRKNDLYLNVIDTLRNNPDELKRFGIVSQNKQPMVDIDFDDFMSAAEEQTLREVNSKVYTISAMENGQKIIAYINKDLADAFAKIDNVIGSPAMQDFANIGKKITNPLKAGITGYNPIFAIANASRDIPTALIQSQYGVGRTTKNMVRAIGQMATNGEMWNRYLALGGKTGGYINAHKGFERNLKMSKNPIRNVWEGMKTVLGSFGEATESIPRFAEFMSSMEKYGDTAKAITDAAEITVNFARAGEVTKTLDAWTLYLNAAVQGIDKFARTMKAHPLRTSARSIGVVGAPYALLMVANWNNPHYQDLNDRTKQNYFCIPNMAGEYDEQGNAKTFIKIPVNREYGTIFASSLDVIGDYLTGKADPLNGFSDTVKENFLPPNPLTDNVLAPIYYNLPNNTDFAGRKIVPTNMENLSPELQQDYSTSGLAKGISKAASNLNIPSDTLRSPKKVDYLIDSFGGYLGQIGQAATDQSIESVGDRAKGVTIDPFIDRFSADPRFSSGVISDFYDDKESAERAYNDIKFTTGDKGQEYVANKVYTAIQSELSDLSKQEKEILSGNLSNSEKDRKIKKIREQRNEIARGAAARVEDAIAEYKQNPNYAVLDAQQKESYEKKYKDLGVSKEEYAVAKQIISDTDAGTNAAKAYALLENGQSVELAIAMTSEKAVEEASEYKKNGVTYDEIQKANQIVKDSGYSKSVGKAYALLSNGTSEGVATMMTSERAVKNATRCKQAGVTPEVLDKVANYIDTNGNGSYTKDEIMAFFDANGAEFTQAQKAAIFMSLNTSKYNPY